MCKVPESRQACSDSGHLGAPFAPDLLGPVCGLGLPSLAFSSYRFPLLSQTLHAAALLGSCGESLTGVPTALGVCVFVYGCVVCAMSPYICVSGDCRCRCVCVVGECICVSLSMVCEFLCTCIREGCV